MNRRLFAPMAAIAVLAGTLALGQVPATAMSSTDPGEDSSQVNGSPAPEAYLGGETSRAKAPRGGFGPMDVFKYVKGLYDDYKTCQANEAIGQPCNASDSTNIREALSQLQKLNEQVAKLQKTLDEKLDDLDVKISQSELNNYEKTFTQISENGPSAIRAFSALVDCQAAKLAGKSECARFSVKGTGASAPVDDALRFNRNAFLDYTDQNSMPKDFSGTVALYAGPSGSGLAKSSYAYLMWRFAKLKVDIAAASPQVFRRSDFATFVTPSMSTEVNSYLRFYSDLLATHGELLYLRAVVKRDVALASGNSDAAANFQDTADLLRDQIADKIDSTDANSVGGVNETYRLTPLETGEIAMATSKGTGALIYMTQRNLPGADPMRAEDVAALGQGLSLYGKYSTLQRQQPAAFPQGTDWYVVRKKAIELVCDSSAIIGESGKSNVTWLPTAIDERDRGRYTATDVTTKVRLLDSQIEWDKGDLDDYNNVRQGVANEKRKSCGDGRGKDYLVNIWDHRGRVGSDNQRRPDFLATELRYPMAYDWEKFTFGFGLFKRDAYFGKGVAIQQTTQVPDALLHDMSANKMVRWPDNFDPTGMPDSYGR